MGVSSIEERKSTCCLSPKIYQPPSDMDDIIEFPRKKKMFSSSSFYEEPNAIYPTVEEQVKLCRKIAESLSDDSNVKSKGANMFFKRVKRAEKWIVTESKTDIDEEFSESKDITKMPYVRPSTDGPPKLKLILDPRHLVDMNFLLKQGVDIVKHDTVSPDVCHDIVKDLNSPTGKGAQLFAKRKQKSEEWVVDEEKVKYLMETRYGEYSSPEPPMHPRVRELSELDSQIVADTVIKAAEAKVMTYPNAIPHVPVIESLDGDTKKGTTPAWQAKSQQSAAYRFSAPKGWMGSTTASPLPVRQDTPLLPAAGTPEPAGRPLSSPYPLAKSKTFANFNSTPKAWNPQVSNQFRPGLIKPVKPPSVLVQ